MWRYLILGVLILGELFAEKPKIQAAKPDKQKEDPGPPSIVLWPTVETRSNKNEQCVKVRVSNDTKEVLPIESITVIYFDAKGTAFFAERIKQTMILDPNHSQVLESCIGDEPLAQRWGGNTQVKVSGPEVLRFSEFCQRVRACDTGMRQPFFCEKLFHALEKRSNTANISSAVRHCVTDSPCAQLNTMGCMSRFTKDLMPSSWP